jgi:hypothetical protein
MKCACPWCSLPVEPGCYSTFGDEPTCKQHSFEGVCQTVKDANARLTQDYIGESDIKAWESDKILSIHEEEGRSLESLTIRIQVAKMKP